jgi:hypothetical protein
LRRRGGRWCRDGWRLDRKRFLLTTVLEIQGRAADRKTSLRLQRDGRWRAVFGCERLHALRGPLGVDKEPLSKRHSKGAIRVEKTQGGWIRDRAAVGKKGEPDF